MAASNCAVEFDEHIALSERVLWPAGPAQVAACTSRSGKPAGGGELDLDTRTRTALLRSLRWLGEQGFALMSQRWRTLQRVMLSPGKICDIARAALVLVQFDHKMIT